MFSTCKPLPVMLLQFVLLDTLAQVTPVRHALKAHTLRHKAHVLIARLV